MTNDSKFVGVRCTNRESFEMRKNVVVSRQDGPNAFSS